MFAEISVLSVCTDRGQSPYDPTFIGCWWLGCVVIAILIFIFAVLFLCFPKHYRAYYLYHKHPPANNNTKKKSTVQTELKG